MSHKKELQWSLYILRLRTAQKKPKLQRSPRSLSGERDLDCADGEERFRVLRCRVFGFKV